MTKWPQCESHGTNELLDVHTFDIMPNEIKFYHHNEYYNYIIIILIIYTNSILWQNESFFDVKQIIEFFSFTKESQQSKKQSSSTRVRDLTFVAIKQTMIVIIMSCHPCFVLKAFPNVVTCQYLEKATMTNRHGFKDMMETPSRSKDHRSPSSFNNNETICCIYNTNPNRESGSPFLEKLNPLYIVV